MTTNQTNADRVGDLAASVVDHLANLIESGKGIWSAPWYQGADIWSPTNATTHKPYTGGNRFVLAVEALYANKVGPWATYKQWASIDAYVRKGEKGTVIFVPKTWEKECESRKITCPAGPHKHKGIYWSTAVIFASSQVDGYTPADIPEPLEIPEDAHAAFTAAAIDGLKLKGFNHDGGNRAYYVPAKDEIHLPEREKFTSVVGYYSTAWHELSHSTGHKTRLGRKGVNGEANDRETYAIEELIAELSTAILCVSQGLTPEPREDHAGYIGSWLGALKETPRLLLTVASQAEKAANLIESFVSVEQEGTVVAA